MAYPDTTITIISAQAEIHHRQCPSMDSRLRGNDVVLTIRRAEKRSAFRRFGQPWRMALSLIRPTDYRKLADVHGCEAFDQVIHRFYLSQK